MVPALLASAALGFYPRDNGEAEPFTLRAIHEVLRQQYPNVRHISAEELKQRLGRDGEIVIFDVREAEEYAVSHIPGAIRVDPGSAVDDFMTRHAPAVKGKIVVFYCSVGARSSHYAAKAQDALRQAGAVSVYNLRNGIFGWHNQDLDLTDGRGTTKAIHPYSALYRPLLKRPEHAAL